MAISVKRDGEQLSLKDKIIAIYNSLKAYVNEQIQQAEIGMFRYKGSVATHTDLPLPDPSNDVVINVGDTYDVVAGYDDPDLGEIPPGTNWAWNGEKWDPLGGSLGTFLTKAAAAETYATKESLTAGLAGKADKADATLAPIYSQTPIWSHVSGPEGVVTGPAEVAENVWTYWLDIGDYGYYAGDYITEADALLATSLTFHVGLSESVYVRTGIVGYRLGPSDGPNADKPLATAAQGAKADSAYQKPSGGIPATDMAQAVQDSLQKADNAISWAEAEAGITEWIHLSGTLGRIDDPAEYLGPGNWSYALVVDGTIIGYSSTFATDDEAKAALLLVFNDTNSSRYGRIRLPKMADVTLTPVSVTTNSGWKFTYSGTITVNSEAVTPATVSMNGPDSTDQYVYSLLDADGQALDTVTDDICLDSVTFTVGGVTVVASRITTSSPAYQLGAQSDKPLQPAGAYLEKQTDSAGNKTAITMGTRASGYSVGESSVSEGTGTASTGVNAHSEGLNTKALANAAHSEGNSTSANAAVAHTEGDNTIASNRAEHAEGIFNKSNSGTRHSIGVGTSQSNRKNAFEVMSDGKVYVMNVGGYTGTNPGSDRDLAAALATMANTAHISPADRTALQSMTTLTATSDIETTKNHINTLMNILKAIIPAASMVLAMVAPIFGATSLNSLNPTNEVYTAGEVNEYVATHALSRAEAMEGFTEWKCEPATYNGLDLSIVFIPVDEQYRLLAGDSPIGSVGGMGQETNLLFHAEVDWFGVVDLTATRTRLRPTPEMEAAWNNKQDTIADLAAIRSGAALGATAVQPAALADALAEAAQFREWFPGGEAKSIADCTPNLKFDWENADSVSHTVEVLPFCNTGTSEDNSDKTGRVVIPPYVADGNGVRYAVVGVAAKGVFEANENLVVVVAPTTVTTIGPEAFATCVALTTVSLPATTTIGNGAFYGCVALTTVSLPAATTIGEVVFSDCLSLSSLSLPAATSIKGNAFSKCTSLTAAFLPAVTNIEDIAFYGCAALTSVDFGNSLTAVPALSSNTFPDLSQSGHTCRIIVPDGQFAAWTADPDWAALTSMGYQFTKSGGTYLKDANGIYWELTVGTDGVLGTTAATNITSQVSQ